MSRTKDKLGKIIRRLLVGRLTWYWAIVQWSSSSASINRASWTDAVVSCRLTDCCCAEADWCIVTGRWCRLDRTRRGFAWTSSSNRRWTLSCLGCWLWWSATRTAPAISHISCTVHCKFHQLHSDHCIRLTRHWITWQRTNNRTAHIQ